MIYFNMQKLDVAHNVGTKLLNISYQQRSNENNYRLCTVDCLHLITFEIHF